MKENFTALIKDEVSYLSRHQLASRIHGAGREEATEQRRGSIYPRCQRQSPEASRFVLLYFLMTEFIEVKFTKLTDSVELVCF